MLETRGFLFEVLETGWLKRDGLPDFYQASFHSKEYVLREWSKYFEVLAYAEAAISMHQDAVLLRKPPC